MFTQKQIEAALDAYVRVAEFGEPSIEAMKAALEAAETAAWQPIKTVPKNDWFLVLEREPVKDMPTIDIVHSTSIQNVSGKPFTHWRPLPSVPEGK